MQQTGRGVLVIRQKVGIIGCGAIGHLLAHAVRQSLSPLWQLGAVCAATPEKAAPLAKELGVPALERRAAIAACDCIMEATRVEVMPGIVRDCLAARVPVIVLSVGGFVLDPALLDEVERADVPVHVPSGAIAGLDGIMGLREQGLDSVELITVKHPDSLPAGSWDRGQPVPPEMQKACVGLASSESRLLFDGNAGEAIRCFPANANVGIALSLAGLGFQNTRMRILADPKAQTTVHCVRAVAGESRLEAVTRPTPLAENPRSSSLAVYSALALLRKQAMPLRVGS